MNTLELTVTKTELPAPVVDVDKLDTDLAVKAVTVELQKYASETGLEAPAQQTLAEAFRPVFIRAYAAIADALGVADSVKDATCLREIKKSRECRLKIRAVRLEGETVHKSQKESALRFGRAVDGFRNILLAELEPVEQALDAAEKTAERAEAARLAALKASREAELIPLIDGSSIVGDLSELTEAAWVIFLSDHRLLRQAKLDAAAKAEADRLAKEAADRAERERINLENARLKAESEATTKRWEAERKAREEQDSRQRAEMEIARQRIEAERAAERKKANDERRAIEAKVKAERKENAANLAKERASAQAELRRLELEREAEEDRRRVEALQAAAEQARLKAELQARIDAERKKANDDLARAESEAKVKAATERRAAAAPDKFKLEAFLENLRNVPVPNLSDAVLQSEITASKDELVGEILNYIADLSDDKELL